MATWHHVFSYMQMKWFKCVKKIKSLPVSKVILNYL